MKIIAILLTALLISACDKKEEVAPASTDSATPAVAPVEPVQKQPEATLSSLDQILAAQSEETKSRYAYRHPKETLEFFGIQPGMTVVEVLPGDGWYSQILVPYLGENGKLIGQDYDSDMWKNFEWAKEDFIASRSQWPAEWQGKAAGWGAGKGAAASASTISDTPESLNGSVDAVLFIRALHNLFRFESQGGHLTRTLDKTMQLLKPGGVVGIVQHQASEEKTDEWADGSKGYLKKSTVIARMKEAGFELVSESDINVNPKDMPGEDDIVWRLPPSFYTSKDNQELQQQYKEIGESNRMTLLFRKPQ